MRFFRDSAASDRLVKSVASRIVRLPATNSPYQLLGLAKLPFGVAVRALKTFPDPLRLRPMRSASLPRRDNLPASYLYAFGPDPQTPCSGRFVPVFIGYLCAGGGNRTRTPLARPRILSPVRLPVPPPRHVIQYVEPGDSTGLAAAVGLERILKGLSIVEPCNCCFETVTPDAVVTLGHDDAAMTQERANWCDHVTTARGSIGPLDGQQNTSNQRYRRGLESFPAAMARSE
jgi:hypothetical protein